MFAEGLKGQIFDILTIDENFTFNGIKDAEQKVQHRCLAEAGWTHDGIGRSSLDLQVKILKEVFDVSFFEGVEVLSFVIRLLLLDLVTKADVLELNVPFLEVELLSIRRLNNLWRLIKHVEEVLDVHLGLCYLTEESAHIEQRTGKLHEVGLDKDEVSRCHDTVDNIVCRHEKIYRQASRENYCLSDIELRQTFLNLHCTAAKVIKNPRVAPLFQLLICKLLHCLVVHDRLIEGELRFLFSVLSFTDLHASLCRESLTEVSVQ